ncbi:MAG: hypothetical protein AB7F36_13755 [Reyranellaceae bacterium]
MLEPLSTAWPAGAGGNAIVRIGSQPIRLGSTIVKASSQPAILPAAAWPPAHLAIMGTD